MAHAPENTLGAFTLALRLGANGLESDAWTTADGHVVLDHDGVVKNLREAGRYLPCVSLTCPRTCQLLIRCLKHVGRILI